MACDGSQRAHGKVHARDSSTPRTLDYCFEALNQGRTPVAPETDHAQSTLDRDRAAGAQAIHWQDQEGKRQQRDHTGKAWGHRRASGRDDGGRG
jgi:hypothetical protein